MLNRSVILLKINKIYNKKINESDASIKHDTILYETQDIYRSFHNGDIISCCCYNSNIKDAIDRFVIWYDYNYIHENIHDYRIEIFNLANLSDHISSTVYIYYI